jgi:chitinase
MRVSRRSLLRGFAGAGAASVFAGCGSPATPLPTSTTQAVVTAPTPTLRSEATAMPTIAEATSTAVSIAPPPAPTTVTPGPGRLVGYLASWNIGRSYAVSDVPVDKISHLNYAFATISDNGDCTLVNPKNDPPNFAELRKLRQRQPLLRTLISIGGAGSAKRFSPVVGSAQAQQRFAQSCVSFIKKYGLDGVDIDWEFPTGRDEGKAFTALLAELRRQLDDQASTDGTRYLLTVAAPAGPNHYLDLELDRIGASADWINLMTYAFHGTWSTITNFDAPLFASSTDPSPTLQRIVYNADAAVQTYLAAGVPPDKLVVGVPFYGYGWKGVADVNHGLYQPATGSPPGTLGPGVFTYRDLAANYRSIFTRYWHDEAQVPWLFNAQTGVMISYDDPDSVGRKADYVRDRGLGGAMIWELTTDDTSHSLVAALHARLHATPAS